MYGFLAGVKVVELGHILLGPLAGQVLGDYGADVVKVESISGDMYRNNGLKKSPKMSAQWLNCNRNKRSIALDLKDVHGRKVLQDLLKNADVFIHNYRSSAVERLGFGYDQVKALNPSIVYAFSGGFGQKGRYKDLPAFDDVIQGYSGITSLNGMHGDAPQFFPAAITDQVTSMNLSSAVLAALYKQKATGEGCMVEVPMMESTVALLMNQHLNGETFVPAIGAVGYNRMISEHRKPVKTKDSYIIHGVYALHHWRIFADAINDDHLLDSGWLQSQDSVADNIDALYQYLADKILPTNTTQHWIELFQALDIPCAPVNDFSSLVDDPHLQDVALFEQVIHPTEGQIRQVRLPIDVTGLEKQPDIPAPSIGNGTDDILSELGYDNKQIIQLKTDRVVA